MKTKMIMTETLANKLIETLCCVAISANGGAPLDEEGNCLMTDADMEKAFDYASRVFYNILSEWENDEREWAILAKAENP